MGLRASMWDPKDRISARIFQAELQKIPYIIVVGDREISENNFSIRVKIHRESRANYPQDFLSQVHQLCQSKAILPDLEEKVP